MKFKETSFQASSPLRMSVQMDSVGATGTVGIAVGDSDVATSTGTVGNVMGDTAGAMDGFAVGDVVVGGDGLLGRPMGELTGEVGRMIGSRAGDGSFLAKGGRLDLLLLLARMLEWSCGRWRL
jgi:hypothetical protein